MCVVWEEYVVVNSQIAVIGFFSFQDLKKHTHTYNKKQGKLLQHKKCGQKSQLCKAKKNQCFLRGDEKNPFELGLDVWKSNLSWPYYVVQLVSLIDQNIFSCFFVG